MGSTRKLCRACVETLEDRRLLSAITFADGVLSVTGDSGSNNNLAVSLIGGNMLAAVANNQTQVVPLAQVQQIDITGGDEQNNISIDKRITLPTTVNSYGPADQITSGDPYVTVNYLGDSSETVAPASGTSSTPDVLTAVITDLSPHDIVAGQAVDVDAMNSNLAGDTPLTATFQWNFGDATSSSEFNSLAGFNAAHVYNVPGEYQISLTITGSDGDVSTATTQVNVSAATSMRTIYVSTSGSDSNSGLSPNAPIQTVARAQQLLGSNTQVLFQAGDRFSMDSSLYVYFSNVTLSSYGNGPQPVLYWTGGETNYTMIDNNAAAFNLTISGLTFDSIYGTDTNETPPTAITPSGSDIAITDNTFLNIDYAINLNNCPTGVLVQDCSAPQVTYTGQVLPEGTDDVTSDDVTGLRGYLVWTQGSDITIVGNYAANSTRQHIVRVGGANLLNIQYNNFTNLSRLGVDPSDMAKDTIDLQMGTYAFIANNTLSGGPTGVGPLTTQPSGFNYAIFSDNTLYVPMNIEPGASNVLVEGNVSYLDGNTEYYVNGYDTTNNRGVVNAIITGNTVINSGPTGDFLSMDGPASEITLTNNLYVAPNLVFGDNGAGGVYVETADLSSFSLISGNIWPVNNSSSQVDGDENFVGPAWLDSYVSATTWNSFSQVQGDTFETVTLPSDYESELAQFTETGVQLFADGN
jgi:hypothetical protein